MAYDTQIAIKNVLIGLNEKSEGCWIIKNPLQLRQLLGLYHPIQNLVSKASARNQFLAAVKFSITDKPQQPILIVTSQADRLVDYRCSQKLAQTWQSGYAQHESAGHDLPLDEPEWLAAIIRQWVDAKIGVCDTCRLKQY